MLLILHFFFFCAIWDEHDGSIGGLNDMDGYGDVGSVTEHEICEPADRSGVLARNGDM